MDENEVNQKKSFFTRIKLAIFGLEKYDLFAIEQPKVAIGYILKLILISSLIVAIGVTYKFATTDLTKVEEIQEFITQDTINYIESMPKEQLYGIFYVVSVIYLFAMYCIIKLLDVLLLSILGFLTSRISKISLKYYAIVNVGIYALTLPIILNTIYVLINCFTGFEIKYFQIMYNAIAYIYLVTAILMIKSEIIRQEIEIAKLEEEQKRVREELERQQEEQRKKEEQRRKEKEEEEAKKEQEGKKERKKKKEKDDGKAPEGTSAISEQN